MTVFFHASFSTVYDLPAISALDMAVKRSYHICKTNIFNVPDYYK
jgi:hypothetical protein